MYYYYYYYMAAPGFFVLNQLRGASVLAVFEFSRGAASGPERSLGRSSGVVIVDEMDRWHIYQRPKDALRLTGESFLIRRCWMRLTK